MRIHVRSCGLMALAVALTNVAATSWAQERAATAPAVIRPSDAEQLQPPRQQPDETPFRAPGWPRPALVYYRVLGVKFAYDYFTKLRKRESEAPQPEAPSAAMIRLQQERFMRDGQAGPTWQPVTHPGCPFDGSQYRRTPSTGAMPVESRTGAPRSALEGRAKPKTDTMEIRPGDLPHNRIPFPY